MSPGADQQLLLGASFVGHRLPTRATEIGEATVQEDVIPGSDMIDGHIHIVRLPLQVDWPPVGTVFRMAEVIGEVAGHRLQQLRPGHKGQPAIGLLREGLGKGGWSVGQLTLKLRQERVCEPLALDGVSRHEDGVGDLPAQLERSTAVIHPALMEVCSRRDRKGSFEMRRTGGNEEVLRGAQIGLAHNADVPVRPR